MFKSLIRKSVLTALVSGVGVLALSAVPAYAGNAGAAEGVVTGSVGLSPGVSATCATQAFNFAPIQIAGTMVSGTAAAVGTIVTPPVTGGTDSDALGRCPVGQEDIASAKGHVNAFTLASVTGVGSVSGGCSGDVGGRAGTYERIGGIVLVSLKCNVNVTSPVGTVSATSNLGVTVVAWFQPTTGDGVTTPATQALFAGDFTGVGTS